MTDICIIGAGYVGLTYAAGLASKGFHVSLVDVNEQTIQTINQGKSPIDEPGMNKFIAAGINGGLIKGYTCLSEVFSTSTVFFICVGTYCDDIGNINLAQVKAVAQGLHDCLKASNPELKDYKVFCVKSTVICGTTDSEVLPILEKSGKKVGRDFGIAMSPEFLKEGSALEDILHPDKIVIGGIDQRSIDAVKQVLCTFLVPGQENRLLETDLRSAELIKYAQNAFLATKISFINELSRFAELFGVDVGTVAKAIGMDARISPKFLNAGPGFGGSCFPKDVRALLTAGKSAGIEPILLKAVLDVNEVQKSHVLDLLSRARNINGLVVAVLGLAFKANTGDTREAVSRKVILGLLDLGAARVQLHDPSSFAREEIQKDFPASQRISYHETAEGALAGSSACLILTEWDEYKGMGPEKFTSMAPHALIVDARRILPKDTFRAGDIELVTLGESTSRSFTP